MTSDLRPNRSSKQFTSSEATQRVWSLFLCLISDGEFVQDELRRLLRDGRVGKGVKVLITTGIASDEGVRFASANVKGGAAAQPGPSNPFDDYITAFVATGGTNNV
ncbi:hypothetical protein Daus18300_006723 [Diaporthe australafricana]|uniref:Uncharacterized protein n=1 Tax=Diaporthe australafricana TaxID=127596 RepID=A0ABR3WSG5_9PEZI